MATMKPPNRPRLIGTQRPLLLGGDESKRIAAIVTAPSPNTLHATPAVGIELGEDVANDVAAGEVRAHPGGDGEVVGAEA